MMLLTSWNHRCSPHWSEKELRDKLLRARRYGREPIGGLLGAAIVKETKLKPGPTAGTDEPSST